MVLIDAIPRDDPMWVDVREAEAKEQKAKPDLIRDRQAAFEARNQRAKGASGD